MRNSKTSIDRTFRAIDGGWLAQSRYLTGDELTIADMSAYVEIGQLRSEFTNIYDFAPLPNIRRWLDDMAQVAYHDEVHASLYELGDISVEAPAIEGIINANKQGFRVLREQLAGMRD